MPLIGMFQGDPCPWPGRLGEGRGGDGWGRVGGSCLWRSWGGTEARRAQQPAALHPLCPSLLSVQRPRGETRGCMPSLPASTGAHSEFQVPKPCTFTSLGSPAASQVGKLSPSGAKARVTPAQRAWGVGGGRRVAMGISAGWCLCGPPCLVVHWGMGAIPSAGHTLFSASEQPVHPSVGLGWI